MCEFGGCEFAISVCTVVCCSVVSLRECVNFASKTKIFEKRQRKDKENMHGTGQPTLFCANLLSSHFFSPTPHLFSLYGPCLQ